MGIMDLFGAPVSLQPPDARGSRLVTVASGQLSRSRTAFRIERGIGASLPASGFVVVSRFQVVKEQAQPNLA